MAQGMRVNPAFRGEGMGTGIVSELFSQAHKQGGTTVLRNSTRARLRPF